jgi:flagellar hook assembly protein FlgD
MGLYELVVSAKDRAGNKAGLLDYRVTFKVANTAPDLILSFYPNPFSNRTRFSFTLWGNYIPTGVQLQIFNSLGQLVRLVRADALGPLRLGRTVALFEWDGTDQGGHALANGVYSCRVVASSVSGENTPYKKIGDGLLLAAGKVYLQR